MPITPLETPLPQLPPRQAASHKGDFGRLLLIGGSQGMAGSISLSGMAALRSGAGLVKLAVPSVCQSTVASFDPCYMTIPLATDVEGRIALAARETIAEAAAAADVIACGPGLGQSLGLQELVGWLYQVDNRPMVFDADALNNLAHAPNTLLRPGGPRVFTPHPGEFRRLTGLPAVPIAAGQDMAETFAARWQVVVVLKGEHTVITDGRQTAINTTGNPGMATGGTGDVLTGSYFRACPQGLSTFDAARSAPDVHGLCRRSGRGRAWSSRHDRRDLLICRRRGSNRSRAVMPT